MEAPATGIHISPSSRARRNRAASASASARSSAVIGGLVLDVRAPQHDAIAAALGGLATVQAGTAPGPSIDVGHVGAPPDRPPDVEWPAVDLWHGPELFAVSGSARGRADDHGLVLDGDGPDARRLLPLLLGRTLPAFGHHVVHAAALVDPARRGWLALGASGAGKSTVAHAAFAAGFAVLGDDIAVVRAGPGDGPPLLSAFPAPVRAPMPTAAEVDGRGRATFHIAVAGEAPLAGVLLIAHGDDPACVWAEVDAVTGLEAVLDANSAGYDPITTRRWFPLAGAVQRVGVRRLALGTDGAARGASTGARLAELV